MCGQNSRNPPSIPVPFTMPSTLENTSWFATHLCPQAMASFTGTPSSAGSSVQESNDVQAKFVTLPSSETISM